MIELEGVWFRYPGSDGYVLRNASLSVERGDSLAIVGENGSGKSTLLMVTAGLLRPERGRVLFEGKDLRSLVPDVRRRIGIVFQDPDDQLFNSTVYDELAYTLRQLGWSEADVRRRVLEVAGALGLTRVLERHPFKLSYGEKKLVAIASAIAHEPDVLMLDEPTAYLSGSSSRLVTGLVARMLEEGRTLIAVSHDARLLKLCRRLAVLSNGALKLYESLGEALNDREVREALGIAEPL